MTTFTSLASYILPPVFLIAAYALVLPIYRKHNQSGALETVVPSFLPPPSPSDPLPSLLLPLVTTHLRILPEPSRHAFRYPLLYLGLDVDELEAGRLNLGRVFGFGKKGPRKWRFAGVQEDGYLTPEAGTEIGAEQPAMRKKLGALLAVQLASPQATIDERMKKIYLVTMPAYLGFEGINPLSVWFCYESLSESALKLWTVVLEVHNTFGERHIYVLEAGVKEDEKVPTE